MRTLTPSQYTTTPERERFLAWCRRKRLFATFALWAAWQAAISESPATRELTDERIEKLATDISARTRSAQTSGDGAPGVALGLPEAVELARAVEAHLRGEQVGSASPWPEAEPAAFFEGEEMQLRESWASLAQELDEFAQGLAVR